MPALHDTVFRRAAIIAAACGCRYRIISYTWELARNFMGFWDSSYNVAAGALKMRRFAGGLRTAGFGDINNRRQEQRGGSPG